jgi:predicted O-methyltransferase YrrM
MRTVNIKQKLEEMGVALDSIQMGDFDYIGEFTAKRDRKPGDPNYRKAGAFYRSNYERGILIYYLIRQHNLTSMLEIGFGRGYSTFCAARAFHDAGIVGKIVTVDPNIDENFLKALQQVLPNDWFKYVHFARGTSQQILPQLQETFDLVYIDGDHSYEGTKFDWENTKDKWNRHLLFDDYHMASKNDPGIKCSQLIDEVDDPTKELIIMDRRMFFDDRRTPDEEVDYGQVLLSKPAVPGDERADW